MQDWFFIAHYQQLDCHAEHMSRGRRRRFRRFASHIGSTSGSMGYGVPAAVAMKRLYPDRPVIAISGDGDFLVNGQKFATAVQYELPIIVIVVDNGAYGTIRMDQEREYPGRVYATELDFAAYARAFGEYGIYVGRTADFPDGFAAARQSGKPAIIHLKTDLEAITPSTRSPGSANRRLRPHGTKRCDWTLGTTR
jgi:acetolactate synthase-1/2/3 large subunit